MQQTGLMGFEIWY